DDGINCAGGNDSSSTTTRPGMNGFNPSGSINSNIILTINGGTIYVNASGDGLDANGSIYIYGGTTYVSGPTDNGNGSLDYDGTCLVDGGTIILAGSSGMLQTPQATSKVPGFTYTGSTQKAGSVIEVKDSSGNTLVSFTANKQFQNITSSSELYTLGQTYDIYVNGSKLTSITLTSQITSVGTSSGGQGGMPGGR
ncbi:MAG: dockerin type 1, partial [Bacilli bacterium]